MLQSFEILAAELEEITLAVSHSNNNNNNKHVIIASFRSHFINKPNIAPLANFSSHCDLLVKKFADPCVTHRYQTLACGPHGPQGTNIWPARQ